MTAVKSEQLLVVVVVTELLNGRVVMIWDECGRWTDFFFDWSVSQL